VLDLSAYVLWGWLRRLADELLISPRRRLMANLETQSLTQTGMVEVSGWDEDEVFFVERSQLAWDEYAGKRVTLSMMLSEGSIIFVRPIQPTALHRANPIPYVAEFLGCNPEGNHQFRLNGVQPRHSREDYTVN
jgi:hypothetical protein